MWQATRKATELIKLVTYCNNAFCTLGKLRFWRKSSFISQTIWDKQVRKMFLAWVHHDACMVWRGITEITEIGMVTRGRGKTTLTVKRYYRNKSSNNMWKQFSCQWVFDTTAGNVEFDDIWLTHQTWCAVSVLMVHLAHMQWTVNDHTH